MDPKVHSRARSDARFLKEVAEHVSTMPWKLDVKKTNEQIKDLTKERKNYGDKMLKTGAVLLAFPDPITDAAAVPLLVAGTVLRSRRSSGVKDVYKDLSETLSSLASLSSSL